MSTAHTHTSIVVSEPLVVRTKRPQHDAAVLSCQVILLGRRQLIGEGERERAHWCLSEVYWDIAMSVPKSEHRCQEGDILSTDRLTCTAAT